MAIVDIIALCITDYHVYTNVCYRFPFIKWNMYDSTFICELGDKTAS